MYSFDRRQSFRKSFYAIENTVELHYRLLNTLNLIVDNGYLYCFCNKYKGPREEFGSGFIGRPSSVKTNIFRIQVYDSIMCGYFCIGFIDFMAAGKTLIEFTYLFSPNNLKKRII